METLTKDKLFNSLRGFISGGLSVDKTPSRSSPYLVSPLIDFLALGGGSIIFLFY